LYIEGTNYLNKFRKRYIYKPNFILNKIMAIDEMTDIDITILQQLNRFRNNAILIEGFMEENYQSTITKHVEYMKKQSDSLSIDFFELMNQDSFEMKNKLMRFDALFVYNMDLFGENIDPDLATLGMQVLRSAKNEGEMSQLMFAGPNANLDYNSREGYTYHDNHPLGNWCKFYRITNGGLIGKSNPIQHSN